MYTLLLLLSLSLTFLSGDEGPGMCPHGGHRLRSSAGPRIDPEGVAVLGDQGGGLDPDGVRASGGGDKGLGVDPNG